ncbi:MAG: hypothetical protein E7067_08725 [Lentimicrobiaceae bacterium]|nr:hypothetical protein [Lentimicrobiaceae bacterium]
MNRIIIIGNGFDLAHGLPTSYENFIKWYQNEWVKKLKNCYENKAYDELCEFQIFQYDWDNFFRFNHYDSISWEELIEIINDNPRLLSFKTSRLLNAILKHIEKNKWVDIEKEYYNLLSADLESSNDENIKRLNNELACLKNNLIAYLKDVEKGLVNEYIIKDNIKEKILEPINPRDISVKAQDKFNIFKNTRFAHYNNFQWESLLKKYNYEKPYKLLNEIDKRNSKEFYLPDSILLLNFNYTKTADLYLPNEDIFKVNHIHGKLSNSQSIIFGYGDELDENYKRLLKDNNNEYLKNIKSINYLNSTNYREMLSYIESSPYQIYIMGHSCGLSDKTLLNTLFEHDNCVSIKPFYYINNEGFDNYTEIVQNISRNFTDMKLMRDRVVNKTFCKTLE